MKTHILENGILANTLLATVQEAQAAFPGAVCIDGAVGGIGWAWDGETLTEPEVAAPTPEALREAAKAARTLAVSQITVTTAAGNTFDGDETSQNRMARAILALQATNTPATLWVLSDNSVIDATVAELAEALAMSGAAQSALWVIE